MSQTQKVFEAGGRKITLIGTAHVSAESVKEVDETIRALQPDCVAVELDEKRASSIENKEKYQQLDIIKVLRRHEGFLLLSNLVLASFQRRMGKGTGTQPGSEMLAAMNVAKEMNIPVVMADRPIQITLKRAWGKNSLWGKSKLLATLLSSAFSNEEMTEEEIEEIKNKNEMDSMMGELAEYMPVVKEVLIDERNFYLAKKICCRKNSYLGNSCNYCCAYCCRFYLWWKPSRFQNDFELGFVEWLFSGGSYFACGRTSSYNFSGFCKCSNHFFVPVYRLRFCNRNYSGFSL